jgi:hypothetical protein
MNSLQPKHPLVRRFLSGTAFVFLGVTGSSALPSDAAAKGTSVVFVTVPERPTVWGNPCSDTGCFVTFGANTGTLTGDVEAKINQVQASALAKTPPAPVASFQMMWIDGQAKGCAKGAVAIIVSLDDLTVKGPNGLAGRGQWKIAAGSGTGGFAGAIGGGSVEYFANPNGTPARIVHKGTISCLRI